MGGILLYIIIGVTGVILGGVITGTILNRALERKRDVLLKEAMEKAEVVKKEKILQAKEKFLQLKGEHEKFVHEKNEEVSRNENRLKQKEGTLNLKVDEFAKKQKEITTIKQTLTQQMEIIAKKQSDLDKAMKIQVEKLEAISNLSAVEAKSQLIETLKEEAKTEAIVHMKDIIDEAKLTANTEAKKIIIETIQRTASEHAIENTVSVFNIESEEIKAASSAVKDATYAPLNRLQGWRSSSMIRPMPLS